MILISESLISVDSEGYALIPLHNYQGNCVTLDKGSVLGLVRQCETPDCGQSPVHDSKGYESESGSSSSGGGAFLGATLGDTGRFEKSLVALEISIEKLSSDQVLQLRGLLHEYSDVFALMTWS